MVKSPAKSKPKAGVQPEAPDVERHDEVYFRHASGPKVGRVLSRGEHGCVIEADGKRHKVRWDGFLGHKVRVRPNVRVVDQGEDGFLVEAPGGERRFVADPLAVIEADGGEAPVRKSFTPLVLLLGTPEGLAKAIKNRPGLSLQDTTDRSGKRTKRWMKTAPDAPKGRRAAAQEPQAAPVGKARQRGDRVTFKIGDLEGQGEVVGSPGAHGAHVRDASGHLHKVLWSQVTGDAKESKESAGAAEPAKAASPAQGDHAKPTRDNAPIEFFPAAEVSSLPERASQPAKTWEALSERGQAGMKEFNDALEGLAAQFGWKTGLNVEAIPEGDLNSSQGLLLVAPLKGEARARQKVETEYDNDWSQVRDMIRGTIAVSSVDEIHAAIAAVEKAGLTLAQQPKDKFTKPTPEGYRDLNTIVTLPGGMLAELQYHLKPMTAAKVAGHKDYEITRTLQAKYGEDSPTGQWSDEDHAAFHQAMKRQRDIYGEAWRKASAGGKSQDDKSQESP